MSAAPDAWSASPLLGLLSGDQRGWLEARSTVERYRAGDQLVREGQDPGHIFFLLRGAIRVFHRIATGREIVVMFCRAPAIFGEIEVVLGVAHIENVAVLEDATEVLLVQRAAFLELLERNPAVALAMLRDTCAKLAMASHNQKALACQDVRTRLATFLVAYALFDGDPLGPDHVRIRARLTQDDMAAALGVTRRAVADEVARWQKLGVLERSDGRYVIQKLEALSGEAAPEHIGLVYDSASGLVVVPAVPAQSESPAS